MIRLSHGSVTPIYKIIPENELVFVVRFLALFPAVTYLSFSFHPIKPAVSGNWK